MSSLPALAPAIAALLRGTVCPSGTGKDDAPIGRDIAWIDLADEREGLRVILRHTEGTRLRASMSLTPAARGGAEVRAYPAFHELATAAAMSRGADVIARQIESKVVAPALPMLAGWLRTRADYSEARARLVEAVARYQSAFPTARISTPEAWDATEARLDLSNGSTSPDYRYLSGHVKADGSLRVDRSSAVPELAAYAIARAVLSPPVPLFVVAGRSVDGTEYLSGMGWSSDSRAAHVMDEATAVEIARREEERAALTRSPDSGVYGIKPRPYTGPRLYTLEERAEDEAEEARLSALYLSEI